MNINFLNFTNN